MRKLTYTLSLLLFCATQANAMNCWDTNSACLWMGTVPPTKADCPEPSAFQRFQPYTLTNTGGIDEEQFSGLMEDLSRDEILINLTKAFDLRVSEIMDRPIIRRGKLKLDSATIILRSYEKGTK